MRRDAERPGAGVGGEQQGDGRRGAPGAGALVETMRDGPGAEGVAGHRVGEGRVEVPGIVLVEKPQQGRRVAGDQLPAARERLEEGAGVGAGLAEAIPTAEFVGPALGRGERGQMGLGLDPLAAVVAPRVAGDLRRSVEEADGVFRGHQRQGTPNQRVGNGIVVAVEAEVRRLPRDPRAHELAGEGVIRERQQAGAFLVQGIRDAPAGGITGHRPLMGRVGDPLRELRVEILDRREAPGREEGVAQVLDHALHAAFLITPGHGAGLRREVVVAGELEQPRVEADVLAGPLEDDAFQVVIQQDSRAPTQRGERLDVATRKLSSVWSRAKRA